ncbi:MAG: hypothetical protein GY795_04485 [Desulfobacterales bacterium]|nr:hypothetical protein [Desulfobacterales bacterium]
MGNNIEPKFELWLELETGHPLEQANRPEENFCNISVKLDNGRRYALNVWTFDFLPLARCPWPYKIDESQEPARYLLPPDLFVEKLDRPTLESIISELLKNNEMKEEWLCDDNEDTEQ